MFVACFSLLASVGFHQKHIKTLCFADLPTKTTGFYKAIRKLYRSKKQSKPVMVALFTSAAGAAGVQSRFWGGVLAKETPFLEKGLKVSAIYLGPSSGSKIKGRLRRKWPQNYLNW